MRTRLIAVASALMLSMPALAQQTAAPGAPAASSPATGPAGSGTSAPSTGTSGSSTAMPSGHAVSDEQVMEHLRGEGLPNIQLERETNGWTARAITPDFRPVTIRLDQRGNVLGARSY